MDYLPILQSLPIAIVGCYSIFRFHRRFLLRFPTSNSIPASRMNTKLRGRVVRVGDGDGFRFHHTPLTSLMWKIPKTRTELKNTISVRIAGVDAPERAHFGNPSQPYSQEAMDWLTAYIINRQVTLHVFDTDRYGRTVGVVYVYKHGIRRNVGLQLVKAGLADVYDQAGAVYGSKTHEKALRNALKDAKARKLGMWSLKNVEVPSAYKKRQLESK